MKLRGRRLSASSSSVIKEENNRAKQGKLTCLDSIRRSQVASTVLHTLHSMPCQLFLVICTLWGLFAQDVLLGWLPRNSDYAFFIITCLVFGTFGLEFLVQCIFHRNYLFRFYCFLDLAGTLALLPDIFALQASAQETDANTTKSFDIWAIAKAGRIARSAGILRVGKIARLLRAVRVVRVFKFVKYFHKFQRKTRVDQANDKESSKDSTIIGMAFADLVSKRVVLGVMLLLGIVPLLDSNVEDRTALTGLKLLETGIAKLNIPSSDPHFTASVKTFNSTFYIHSPIVILNVTGHVLIDNLFLLKGKRNNIIDVICTDDNFLSCVAFDKQGDQTLNSTFNIVLVIFTILMFAIGSRTFNADAEVMIIQPLNKTMGVLKKVGKKIYSTTFAGSEALIKEAVSQSEESLTKAEELEMAYIEDLIREMSKVFNIEAEEGTLLDEDLNKELIQNPDSISIDGDNFVITNPLMLPEQLQAKIPELESLDSTLKHPEAARYFRLFLIKEMNIENLTFYEEATKYKRFLSSECDRIYLQFIKAGSPQQVNISATQRANIEKILDHPSIATFKIAEDEIFIVMKKDPFPRFCKSAEVAAHNKLGKSQILRRHQTNDSISSPRALGLNDAKAGGAFS